MLRHLHHRGTFRYLSLMVSVLLCISFISLLPSTRVSAGAGAACEGDNLRVNWDSLNTPVTVNVNGSTVVGSGEVTGTTVIIGPGTWTVTILQAGDPVATFNAACPGSVTPIEDPNRIPNGSAAGINVVYRRADCGFDLYTYDPHTRTSRLIFSQTGDQQKEAAQKAVQQQASGQNPNVILFTGKDSQGRQVSIYFIYPDQIQINGFFADGKPHVFNFPACIDARTITLSGPTTPSTPPPIPALPAPESPDPGPPQLVVTGRCRNGVATFTVTNRGGAMPAPVSYTIRGRPGSINERGALQLGAGGGRTIRVRIPQESRSRRTRLIFRVSGGAAFAQVNCIARRR